MPTEAPLTEIPEHLLARSKARRAGLSGDSAAAAPATTGDAAAAAAPASAPTPAAPAEAAPPPPPAPKLPWVEAAERRRKIPMWAMSALALLPIWAVVYATTNDPQSPKQAGPVTVGAEVYSSCGSCHGGAGQGGVGPALAGGAVVEVFPEPGEHIRWVMLGTAGYQAEGTATYGATEKPVGGAASPMPAQMSLESSDLLAVVRHERETLSGEAFDIEAWQAAAEELANDPNPQVAEKASEFAAILDEWAALPTGA